MASFWSRNAKKLKGLFFLFLVLVLLWLYVENYSCEKVCRYVYVSSYVCVCVFLCAVDVMRSQWCSSVPVGRAPSFSENSGGNTAGERQGTAVMHTYANNCTRTQSHIARAHTPFPPLSTYLSHFNLFLSTSPRKMTTLYRCNEWNVFTLATRWSLFIPLICKLHG